MEANMEINSDKKQEEEQNEIRVYVEKRTGTEEELAEACDVFACKQSYIFWLSHAFDDEKDLLFELGFLSKLGDAEHKIVEGVLHFVCGLLQTKFDEYIARRMDTTPKEAGPEAMGMLDAPQRLAEDDPLDGIF